MTELRRIFSINLVSLVRRMPSVAQVCRDISINRQQFNRYMAGDNLPSKANMAKIAKYFRVSETDLFSSNFIKNEEIEDLFQPFVERIAKSFVSSVPSLEDGVYYVYLPVENRDDVCLRALLQINKHRLQTRFSRLILYRQVGRQPRFSGWERLDGIVTERQGVMTFLADIRRDNSELLLTFAKAVRGSNGRLLSGISLTSQRGQPFARRMAAEFVGKRQQLLPLARNCGYLELDNPAIDHRIRSIVSRRDSGAPPLLFPQY